MSRSVRDRERFFPKMGGNVRRTNTDYGILRRVDRWTMTGDVEFLTQSGGLTGIPIHMNYSGRSMFGGLPSEGSVVEVSYHLGEAMGRNAFISGVVPAYFESAHDRNTTQEFPHHEKVRPQIPHIVPGSWYVQAEDLSSIQLVDRVGFFITLSDQQKIHVSYHDHSYVLGSMLFRREGAGHFDNFGVISRPNSDLHKYQTTGGTTRNYVTAKNDGTFEKLINEDAEGSRLLLEKSSVLWETSDSIPDIYQLDEKDREKFTGGLNSKPLIIDLMGTVVGVHPDLAGYGKPLTCTVFSAVNDQAPSSVGFTGQDPTLDKDRMLYQFSLLKLLYLPQDKTFGSFCAWDKQGKAFLHLGRSLKSDESSYSTSGWDEDPLGPHRSIEAFIEGSLKAHIGKNVNEEHSVDISTEGKSRFRLGKDDGSKGRTTPLMISLDTSTEGKVKLRIKDDSGASDEQLLSIDLETTRGIKINIQGPMTNDDRALDLEANGKVNFHATNDIKVYSDSFIRAQAPSIHIIGDNEVHINP